MSATYTVERTRDRRGAPRAGRPAASRTSTRGRGGRRGRTSTPTMERTYGGSGAGRRVDVRLVGQPQGGHGPHGDARGRADERVEHRAALRQAVQVRQRPRRSSSSRAEAGTHVTWRMTGARPLADAARRSAAEHGQARRQGLRAGPRPARGRCAAGYPRDGDRRPSLARLRSSRATAPRTTSCCSPTPTAARDRRRPELVRALCDRHAGHRRRRRDPGGADRRADDPAAVAARDEAAWFMDYRNADGSLSEMCGNGVRVLGRYLALHEDVDVAGRCRSPPAPASRSSSSRRRPDGGSPSTWASRRCSARTTVAVGDRELARAPRRPGQPARRRVRRRPRGRCPTAARRRRLRRGGLPRRASTSSSSHAAGPAHVAMRVHERGSGETRSCGTGACAVMVAAAVADEGGPPSATGRAAAYRVDLPGGTLTVRWTDGRPGAHDRARGARRGRYIGSPGVEPTCEPRGHMTTAPADHSRPRPPADTERDLGPAPDERDDIDLDLQVPRRRRRPGRRRADDLEEMADLADGFESGYADDLEATTPRSPTASGTSRPATRSSGSAGCAPSSRTSPRSSTASSGSSASCSSGSGPRAASRTPRTRWPSSPRSPRPPAPRCSRRSTSGGRSPTRRPSSAAARSRRSARSSSTPAPTPSSATASSRPASCGTSRTRSRSRSSTGPR